MPIVNTAEGKIVVALVVDNEGSQESISVTADIARALGKEVTLYNLITLDDHSHFTEVKEILDNLLPRRVKRKIIQSSKIDKTHEHVVDYVMPTFNPATGENTLWFKFDFKVYEQELKLLLKGFTIKFTTTTNTDNNFTSEFIEGGDYIAGSDFLIIGPQCYMKRKKDMDTHKYWADFFSLYNYSQFNSKKVLKLKPAKIYNEVWNKGHLFYHLDLYLTYAGKDYNGTKMFYLAEISKSSYRGDWPLEVKNYFNLVNAYLHYVERQLKDFFKNSKLTIERLPCDPLLGNLGAPAGGSKVYSYNNAIVEQYSNFRKYIMPVYGKSVTSRKIYDAAIQKLSRNCYTKKVNIPNSYISSQGQSLHCITAVLKRD